jgi:rubrerythrin
LPTPKLTNDLTPIEGLVIAIKKELEAMQMYTQLATLSTDAEQELLFS